jgi:hypothetical protein
MQFQEFEGCLKVAVVRSLVFYWQNLAKKGGKEKVENEVILEAFHCHKVRSWFSECSQIYVKMITNLVFQVRFG